MSRHSILPTLLLAASAILTASCTHDAYETGDGGLSYLRADYADITVSGGKVTDIQTDDDVHLLTPQTLTVSDRLPADTMLRRLIHYNMTDASAPVEILSFTPVSILLPHDKAEITGVKRDPVRLTAAWMGRNRRYINLQLGLMVGNTDGSSAPQTVQFLRDSTHTAGRGAVFLSLYHDQAGMPEYYTEDMHISLPLASLTPDGMRADTVSVTVNTYSGTVTKLFVRQDEE